MLGTNGLRVTAPGHHTLLYKLGEHACPNCKGAVITGTFACGTCGEHHRTIWSIAHVILGMQVLMHPMIKEEAEMAEICVVVKLRVIAPEHH